MTIYKPITGFPGYDVGTNGQVRTYWKRIALCRGKGSKVVLGAVPRPMKPEVIKGYLRVDLCRDGKKYHRRIHLLVLTEFRGPRPHGHDGCHENGKRHDARLQNLRWGSKSSNQNDRWKHGTMCFPNAKLNSALVRRLVAHFKHYGSRTATAEHLKVSTSTVNRILNGSTWSHVTGIIYKRMRGPNENGRAT